MENKYNEMLEYFNKKIQEASCIPKSYFNSDPLDSIEFGIILKYIRRKKLEHLKNNNLNND